MCIRDSGKQFLLDSVHAGIDNAFVYGRLDFAGPVSYTHLDVYKRQALESLARRGEEQRRGQSPLLNGGILFSLESGAIGR